MIQIAESIDREQPIPALTQTETAKVMTLMGYPMSRARVQAIEQRALRKLAADPDIAAIFPEIFAESAAQI